jgi:6-phosphogluconolactonase
MNIRVFDDLEPLSQAAARTVLQRASAASRTVIALSGGSTPKRTYELLRGRLYDREVVWVLVDERYVPLDHPRSNARMIQEALFPDGIAPAHRFLHFDTSHADPVASADEFSARWQSAGVDRIDVAILGCGDDGHTASLFPGVPVAEAGIASAVHVPQQNEWRVTLTMPVIRDAALRMVLAAGASKAPILRDVRAGVEHPVALATRGVDSWWFVDRAAYSHM